MRQCQNNADLQDAGQTNSRADREHASISDGNAISIEIVQMEMMKRVAVS